MLKIKAAPRLEPEALETAWIGDDAIDLSASDIDRWCETGDPSVLVARAGGEIARIRYRALTDREVAMLPRSDGDDHGLHPQWFLEAARYGIVSVDGISLRRRRSGGVVGLADASLDMLAAQYAPIPLVLALWAIHGDGPRPDSAERISVSLAEWLGVRVLAETFRARR
jgi:hypothetical protein